MKNSRKCRHIPTNKIFNSVVEMCNELGFSEPKARHQISGRTKNTLQIEYIEKSKVGLKIVEAVCKKCKILKPSEDFGFNKRTKSIRCYTCKKCRAKREKERRKQKGAHYLRVRNIMSSYKVSESEAERLRSIWNCECCGVELTKAKSNVRCITDQVIDHCHETNIIRGVLCSACNLALGHARDSVEVLEKLKDYLINHK